MLQLIAKQFPKLLDRTEWQVLLVAIIVMVANRMFDLGLTEGDVYAMFGGVAGYGISAGLRKSKAAPGVPANDASE